MNTVKTITGFAILAIALFIPWSIWGSDLSGAYAQDDVKNVEEVQPPCVCWCGVPGTICSKEECERLCGPEPQAPQQPPPPTQPPKKPSEPRIQAPTPKTKIIPPGEPTGEQFFQPPAPIGGLPEGLAPEPQPEECKSCNCTVDFPEKGTGENKDKAQEFKFDKKTGGQGQVDIGISCKIKTTGKKGTIKPGVKVKYFLSYSTDGFKTWEPAGEPETKTESIGLEVDCGKDKPFQKWFSVPVNVGEKKGTTSYELHLYAYAENKNCDMMPNRGYITFTVTYDKDGNIKSSNFTKGVKKYDAGWIKKGEWRSSKNGAGWDKDGRSLPPPEKEEP